MKGNDFVADYGVDLERILVSLYFQPGKYVTETLELIEEFVAKFYIKRPKGDEDYLLD